MYWQAKHNDELISRGDEMDFAILDLPTVVSFAIVKPLGTKTAGNVVIWEGAGPPLAYAQRERSDEKIHVIEMPTEKVFVFEHDGSVIRQKAWGSGILAAI